MTTQTQAITFSQFGGPEVLSLQPVALPAPGQGEIQLRHRAVGLNFIDIYHRKGIFAAPCPCPAAWGSKVWER